MFFIPLDFSSTPVKICNRVIKRSHFEGGDLTPPPIEIIAKGMLAPFGNPIILCPPQEAGLI